MTVADGASGDPSCRVHAVTTFSELDATADAWHGLMERCIGTRTPYLSFEWVSTWVRHYSEDGRVHVIVVEHQGSVVGIMPLVLVRYGIRPFAIDVLETVGGESRNLIALVSPGSEDVVARAIAGHLAREAVSRTRLLRVTLVPSQHPFMHGLLGALRETRPETATRVDVCSFAPYAPLPAVWEDYEASIGRRRRKVLSRAQRGLDLARRHMCIREVHGEEIDVVMRHLFELHDARWRQAGIRGLFHDQRARAFHLDIARECAQRGWLHLSEMTIDGTIASAHMVLVLDGVAYMMRSGRDTSFAEHDVGHLHELQLFRQWIRIGLHEADFLRGAEPYKFYWTHLYRVYVEVLVGRRWTSGGMAPGAARYWMRLVRFLNHRHPPCEVLAYSRLHRAMRQELRRMGIILRK